MKPKNLVVILSDEHSRKVLGCYGNAHVKTPFLDRLAARGTLFTQAYTNSPICVPARASFATGRHVHQIGCWDNAHAYDGQPPSWGHHLMQHGHRVISIGKLHYTRSEPQRNGFSEELLPLHILDGKGDLLGLIRDELPRRRGALELGPEAGPGESDYTRYDRQITAEALNWLNTEGRRAADKPWVLYVGFVAPHFPLIAPEEFYGLYDEAKVPMPKLHAKHERPQHPFLREMRHCMPHDEGFIDEAMVRRAITAYFGLVSFLDDNIGQILGGLEKSGLSTSTRILYSSDHGDNLGARGMWGKSTQYEESAGIPLLLAGEDVPAGHVCNTPVSLVDVFPTILESAGVAAPVSDAKLPGDSLFAIARGMHPDRYAFSEYHATGSICGSYMLRQGRYKYVYYNNCPPELFDLGDDPEETRDLGEDPGFAHVLQEMDAKLRSIVDPDETNRKAHADQKAKIEAMGGKAALLRKGMFRFSPPPGAVAVMFGEPMSPGDPDHPVK